MAIVARPIFPVIVVDHKPVGIIVICPLFPGPNGLVILEIAVVPLTRHIFVVGAIIAKLAIAAGTVTLDLSKPPNVVVPFTVNELGEKLPENIGAVNIPVLGLK
jgi:hypothetical protein